jgi:hypothetical protein
MVIYKATFPNGKVYIGKTVNFEMRKYHHVWNANRNQHKHIKMSKSINKYGFESIEWSILCECINLEELKEKEIHYIKLYDSTNHNFGYNMVCGDKEEYELRENFDENYMIDIIKRKLKSNGHDPEKYIIITEEIGNSIKDDYNSGNHGVGYISKKYKISKQRITRFLQREGIELDKNRSSKVNSFVPSQELIDRVISFYKEGKTINQISEIEDLTILIVSRILHDSGVRKSKRFNNGKRYDGRQPKSRKLDN